MNRTVTMPMRTLTAYIITLCLLAAPCAPVFAADCSALAPMATAAVETQSLAIYYSMCVAAPLLAVNALMALAAQKDDSRDDAGQKPSSPAPENDRASGSAQLSLKANAGQNNTRFSVTDGLCERPGHHAALSFCLTVKTQDGQVAINSLSRLSPAVLARGALDASTLLARDLVHLKHGPFMARVSFFCTHYSIGGHV